MPATLRRNSSPTNQLYNKDLNNFAPRFGFAYDLTGKGSTVVRGGWGLFYDAFAQDIFLGHAPYNCAFCPGPAYTGIGPAPIWPRRHGSTWLVVHSTRICRFHRISSVWAISSGSIPNIRTPYTQNFNLNIQQQFGQGGAASWLRRSEGHQAVPLPRYQPAQPGADHGLRYFGGPVQWCNPAELPYCGIRWTRRRQLQCAPHRFPTLFYVNQEESTASSNYHALQTSFRDEQLARRDYRSRTSSGRTRSTTPATAKTSFPTQSQPNNSLAPNSERGNSNFDIRRRFTWNFGYEFPKYEGSLGQAEEWLGLGRCCEPAGRTTLPPQLQLRRRLLGIRRRIRSARCCRTHPLWQRAANILNFTRSRCHALSATPRQHRRSGDSNCLAGTRTSAIWVATRCAGRPLKN